MTVHVHRQDHAIHIGMHSHVAPELTDDDRTWSFSCQPECEQKVLKAVEHTATTAVGVPKTPSEEALASHMDEMAKRDVSRLALALSQLADAQATNR